MAGIGVQDHRNHCSGSRNPRSRSRNRCSRWIGISVQDGPEYALNTVWFPSWNSHNYRSMLSNEDIRDMWTQKVGRFFKSLGGGLARAVTAPF